MKNVLMVVLGCVLSLFLVMNSAAQIADLTSFVD